MKIKKLIILAVLFSLFYFTSLPAVTNNPYIARRQKVLEKMSPNGLVILQTTREGYRHGYGFQQDSDVYYLTGLDESGIVVILSKESIPSPLDDSKTVHSILITNPPPANASNSTEYFQSLQDSTGFDLVCGTKEFRKIFKEFSEIDILYTNIITKNQQDGKTILENRLIKFLEESPNIDVSLPNQLTSSLRMTKDSHEIELMQRAIDITTEAHEEAMKSMTPGLFEYQIEAVIEYVFKFSGSQQLAFPTIVGSGPNSLDLHYELGIRKIQPGDMIVMDIGCEYNHYCADITRTIPASGKFTPQQKEIYNIVLEANQAVIDMLQPGATMEQMDAVVKEVFTKYGYEKYIRHSCTHFLGLDVHDVGARSQVFQPGAVVTVEPGLYIPPNSDLPEAYWNIGVRIEDDVLITTDGHRVLSSDCPKTVKEIETLMKLDGLGNIRF